MHHYGTWNDNWSWLGMGLMMLVVWGSLIALGIVLVHRLTHREPAPTADTRPLATQSSAQQILAERLARGEIEPDDYRSRRAILDEKSNTA